MSDNFWDRKGIKVQEQPPQGADPIQLDEEALSVIQGDPDLDLFEEEDQNTAEIMSDANLRLEQGRLYQMVLQGNIFADTNADPKAIRNVQREIRKFVRERMETMLGIRQEQVAQETVVSSPFNDLEVQVLKMLASKMSKGETEKTAQQQPTGPSSPPPTPKKDGITSISGSLRPQATTPLRREAKPATNQAPKPAPAKAAPKAKSAITNPDGSALQKPIDEMTAEELAAHDAAGFERRKNNYAAKPNNLMPHPSTDQLTMMYTMQANERLQQHATKMISG